MSYDLWGHVSLNDAVQEEFKASGATDFEKYCSRYSNYEGHHLLFTLISYHEKLKKYEARFMGHLPLADCRKPQDACFSNGAHTVSLIAVPDALRFELCDFSKTAFQLHEYWKLILEPPRGSSGIETASPTAEVVEDSIRTLEVQTKLSSTLFNSMNISELII